MNENNKRKQIFEKVEDCVLEAADKVRSGRPIDINGLQALYEGVRVLCYIEQMEKDRMAKMAK